MTQGILILSSWFLLSVKQQHFKITSPVLISSEIYPFWNIIYSNINNMLAIPWNQNTDHGKCEMRQMRQKKYLHLKIIVLDKKKKNN